MATENICPHCAKPVPPTALPGICPECMLKAGFPTEAPEGPHGTKVVPPPPPSPQEIAPLFPQLEILECLGRGGMGAVYKARQPKLGRFVALKLIARDKEADRRFVDRFEREAQALARLSHPNIVTVYDFGEVAGQCYLLMEYVDGLSLRQLLQNGRLKPQEALQIVPRICEALQFAHEHGIVHRDIKPENILLDKQGRVKIADFGIAKLVGAAADRSNLTAEKQVIGTPHYMAPEQVEKPQEVDHRADIYSLGVVFYEMLTGELPLGKFAPPSRKVQVDVRLDDVVLHALEKEPARRYQRASQVKTDVETIAQSGSKPSVIPAPESRLKAAGYLAVSLSCLIAAALWIANAMAVKRFEIAAVQAGLSLLAAAGFLVASFRVRGAGLTAPVLAWTAVAISVCLYFLGASVPSAQPATAIVPEANENSVPQRNFVRLLLSNKEMIFEGQSVTWETLDARLRALPDRAHTVLEWAVTSDQVTMQQQNAWMTRCAQLANRHGLEYASFIGVHPVGGTRGGTVIPDPPPVVVKTVPESGAIEVDPALTEIRVTFSKPMQDGSWSWTMWTEQSFPRINGASRYLEDQRTCVLPVKLSAGKVYAIWINSDGHQNFRDQNGTPAVRYLLTFQTSNP